MKHNLCAFVLSVTVLLTLACTLTEASNSITIKSQLEIVTFWSDFVFVKWYFKVNLDDSGLKMTLLVLGDVLEEDFSSVGIFKIDEEFDPLTNDTTFFIEGPLPLGTISDDFPNDRYEANYFVGCNFLPQNLSLEFSGNLPGPTDNYQASWELRTDSEFPDKLLNLPPVVLDDLEGLTHWFKLHLSIFHRPPFPEYVGVLVKDVPFWLRLFGWILAILIFTPIFYDYITNRALISKRIGLIEGLMIPISAAIIVFVPIYILALHAFEAPLTFPKIEKALINDILYFHLSILVFAAILRLVSSKIEVSGPEKEMAIKDKVLADPSKKYAGTHKEKTLADPKILVVVPCGRSKIWSKFPQRKAIRADEAYIGPPFKVNRAFAQKIADRWVILSAKYGLIKPDFVIPKNYDVSFNKPATAPISLSKLRAQANKKGLVDYDVVIALGGKNYIEIVKNVFMGSARVIAPTRGLRIGKAMKFVKSLTKLDKAQVLKEIV